MTTVRIPADIDQDDKLLLGLGARQLVIVAIPLIALWAIYMMTRMFLPLIVFAPIAVFVAGVTISIALVKRDGIGMDRFVLQAIRYGRSSHRYVNVDDEVLLPPAIARFGLPVAGVGVDGVIDLGALGSAIVCELSAVNLGLQSENEQEALTVAFGRFCNSLSDGMQIVVRSEPVELAEAANGLAFRAGSLGSVGLERGAIAHADFLRSLDGRHDLLRRRVLLVLRSHLVVGDGALALTRQATEALSALRMAGIDARVLDGTAAALELQRAASPNGARQPLFEDHVVRGGRS